MCLINVAHEHLTTQTGKKSKPALINVIGPAAEEPRGRGPTYGAEGREKQIPEISSLLSKGMFLIQLRK